jgi:UDP-glucose 4-epimerase
MVKYLVTGGAGFIGSHMVKHLSTTGMEVLVTDIRRPDYMDKYDKEKLWQVSYKQSDLNNKKSLEEVIKGVDVIFHIAAIFNFFASKELLYKVNVEGTDNICEVARKNGVKKIVNWSSGAIYGDVYGNIPVKEYFQPYPKGNYCISKWEAEQKAFEHHGKDGLDITTIRPAAVYGPGSVYGDAQALHLMKQGILCVKPGFKCSVSSHVHVEDVIKSAYFLSKLKNGIVRQPSDIAYNIADDVPTENHKLLEKAAEVIKNKGLLGFFDIKVPGIAIKLMAHMSENFARITKTKPLFEVEGVSLLLDGHAMDNQKIKNLGYQFSYPNLLEALEEVVKWYDDNNWGVFKK